MKMLEWMSAKDSRNIIILIRTEILRRRILPDSFIR